MITTDYLIWQYDEYLRKQPIMEGTRNLRMQMANRLLKTFTIQEIIKLDENELIEKMPHAVGLSRTIRSYKVNVIKFRTFAIDLIHNTTGANLHDAPLSERSITNACKKEVKQKKPLRMSQESGRYIASRW